MASSSEPPKSAVLVSDFDGTMTQFDFYRLAIESLIPATCPDYWAEYRRGEMTHFEALRSYFLEIDASEEQVLECVSRMQLDPKLRRSVAALRAADWEVVVTSAGCDWYIQRLLKQAQVSLEVHANPGTFQAGQGLRMELPTTSPFLSPTIGIDKQAVVQHWQASALRVAFAGDGFPDIDAARRVPGDLRFARGDLAVALREEGLEYRGFEVWSDVAQALLSKE
jgi:2-hydroxy-3-keto-5-methylthiopentenyl-1-phosphate phosphatase